MNWEDSITPIEFHMSGDKVSQEIVRHLTRLQAQSSFEAGMKEVVNWVKANETDICGYTGSKGSICGSEEWQAKLKEWGL